MLNPGTLIALAPFAWGLYKCSILARRPTTNRKAVHALAVMLGVWLLLLTIIAISHGSAGDTQLLLAGAFLFTAAPLAASTLAVLGLREIWLSKRTTTPGERPQTIYLQGTWQALGALVLAAALLVPFALYAGARVFRGRAHQVTAVPPPSTASPSVAPVGATTKGFETKRVVLYPPEPVVLCGNRC